MSAQPVRVLYVNQTSAMSGAEHSLLELIDGLPPSVEAEVVTPEESDLAQALKARRMTPRHLPGTDLSFRLHPLHTLKGGLWIAHAAVRLRLLASQLGSDVIHANTTRAGLPAGLAAIGARRSVVHVRDWVPPGLLGPSVLAAVELEANAVIANSRFVASQLPIRRRRPIIKVIHNPVDAVRFDPDRFDPQEARARLGLRSKDMVLTLIAHFTPWKGHDDGVRILGGLHQRHPNLRLVLVGSAKFTAPGARLDNAGFEREVRAIVDSLGVGRKVLFLGERTDIPEILRATDLLLVPSWAEAFGRVVLEGMAMKVPVIATSVGGPAEVIRDGVDGLLLQPRSPGAWAAAVENLIRSPDLRATMGRQGRERAESSFSIARHVEQVTALYDELFDRKDP